MQMEVAGYETEYKIIYDELKKVAKTKGEPISYNKLAKLLGWDWLRDYGKCRQIRWMLGNICEAETKQGRPMLSALVVRQDTGIPGSGFFGEAQFLNRYHGDLADEIRCEAF